MTQSYSRREFVRLGTGALAAAALVGSARRRTFAAPADNDKFAGFNVGLQTYTLRAFPVDEALKRCHGWGLKSVEMFDAHFPLKSTPEQIAAMKKKTADLGIRIDAHGVNPFSKDHEANKRWFEFAKAAGIRNISANPKEDAFDSLDKLVAEYDIRIAIHNHGPGAEYDKVNDVLKAVKGRHPNIGACADLGHYIRSNEDPVRAITLLEGRLFGIHLKDFAEPKGDAKGVILGKGQLDVEGVFRALRKVKFPADGALSLEYEENEKDPFADVEACLAAAAEGAQKSRG